MATRTRRTAVLAGVASLLLASCAPSFVRPVHRQAAAEGRPEPGMTLGEVEAALSGWRSCATAAPDAAEFCELRCPCARPWRVELRGGVVAAARR